MAGLSVFSAAAEAPDADAVVLPEGRAWSWADVARRVASVCRRLRETFGVPGDRGYVGDRPDGKDRAAGTRVAVAAESRPATVLTYLALWELGWAAVPLHTRWTETERQAYLDRLGVRFRLGGPDLEDFESLKPSPIPAATEHDPEAIAALIATSGSTGGPKSVALSRRAFLASARASSARLGWRDDDRWLASLPWAHVGGVSVLTRCLEARKALVLTPPSTSFDPARTVAWAHKHRVTLLSLVPTMLRRLVDERVAPPAGLRAVLLGGAAAQRPLVQEGLAAGWPLWLTYGLTEACSQVATGPATDDPSARLLDGVEARIVEGVLEIRGDVLFSGYQPGYEPDGTRRQSSDWFRTGDLARLDGDRVQILGRADDVIVTGGENVHPAEVEAALLEHPRVRAVTVVGVDDERWGQIVTATVVADGVGEAELETFLRGRLAAFRMPRRWRIVDQLPTGAMGKIDRQALAAAMKTARRQKKKPASR